MHEQIRELKLRKICSEPPVEDVQVILQALIRVKGKAASTERNFCFVHLEEGEEDRLEDTTGQYYARFFVFVRRRRNKFAQIA